MTDPVLISVRDPEGVEYADVLRGGESWRAAAERISRTRIGVATLDPHPIDLGEATKRFELVPSLRLSWRPMTRGDLPDVARWRATDHVAPWWSVDGPATLDGVTDAYLDDIEGRTATSMWVLECNGRSVGMCQDYRIGAYPEYALLAPDPDAIGVDYLIGDPAFVGRGLGTRALWTWLVEVPTRYPGSTHCFAAPDHRNRASLRVLQKLGFVEGVWFDEPQPDGRVDTVVGCSLSLPAAVG